MPRILACVFLLATAPSLYAQTTPDMRGALPLVGLGSAVALSGDVLLVGRTGEFPNFAVPPGRAGGVHVFERQAGGWNETGMLSADLPAGSAFGAAVAAAGSLAVVGAPKADDGRGAAFVFARDGTGWHLAARLSPAGLSEGAALGAAVQLDGDVAYVGAPGQDGNGAVFTFRQQAGGWQPGPTLSADLPPASAFGSSVAVSGRDVAIGAPGPRAGFIQIAFVGAPEYHAGTIHVYERAGTDWEYTEALSSTDSTVRTLGAALLFAGGELFAGAPFTQNRGALIRFIRREGTWAEAGPVSVDGLTPLAGYGTALARAGDDLLVGAPGMRAGHMLVLRRAADTWAEVQRVTVEPRGPMVRFGEALAAAGDLAVAGGPGDDYFEGTGFVLRRGSDGRWAVETRAVDGGSGAAAVTGGAVDCTDGMAAGFDCGEVDLLAYLPSSALGAGRGIWISDTWGWTDPETGREIAIVGRIDGTAFVDVSDPSNPVYLGELPLTDGAQANLWRDMKVYAGHAFIVADNAGRHGMQVFDLTRLRGVTNPPARFTADTVYYGIHSSHNLAINEETGFAYTVGNSSGGTTCGGHLHMVDVRNPKTPAFAGCYVVTGSPGTHDLQCVVYQGPDAEYRGREICVSSSANVLDIADVTDKENPVNLARATYPDIAYTHQGWFSEDHRYFYVNDELDEVAGAVDHTRTLIFDMAELDDPVLANQYMGETGASDHNLYVRGRYVYESNYVAGLRILDVSDPVHPVEVGYFDTVPSSPNEPGFAGSWSNYPYFASGIIVVTSIREGLFILKHRAATLVP